MDPQGDSTFQVAQNGVSIFFVIFLGIVILTALIGISRWVSNNNSPVLTVAARVVTKRMKISHSAGTPGVAGADGMMSGGTSGSSHTTYYVTFEDVASGERRELAMRGREYGMLAEGDEGQLTYQGTRYQGFARNRAA